MADDSPLGELVPVEPEELLTRGAVGAPGRLRIEVGLSEPRFARPAGWRTSRDEMALRRALGGVSYPADRERLLAEAGRWLVGKDGLRALLLGLPELTYGGELEVLRRLSQLTSEESEQEVELSADQPAELDPPSTLPGKVEGSSESR
jgi:hypothetical protein